MFLLRLPKVILFFLLLACAYSVAAEREIPGKHLVIAVDQSKTQVTRGEKVVLTAKIKLPPGFHVYAPGIEPPYQPIGLRFEPVAGAKISPVRFPKAKSLRLEAIGETVPAYAGEILLQADVTALSTAADTLQVKATFNYQSCDDKICYVPAKVALDWTFQVTGSPKAKKAKPRS